jgi:hypothetical protein
MEVQQEAIEAPNNMETNNSQQRTSEAEASLSHPGANHGDSSSAMLVGYSTMEEGVQKEAGLDENSNVHGNVHTHTHNFIYSDFAVGSTESESELDESTEAEATRMSRIITTTRGIARRVHEIMEATTESDGISDVTSIFLSETERILTFGNQIRARVAQNPKLVERVAQLQLLTRPPSPPRSNHDSGEEGDDEEEAAVEAGLGTGGADEHDQDDVFVHGHVTPPQSDNDSSNNIVSSPSCKFSGYGNSSIACTCISITNSSVSDLISNISVGTQEPAEIGDADETDDDESVKFLANVEGIPVEIKIESSSDESMTCTKHTFRRRPVMTGEGAYNNLIREAGATTAAADGVTSALQRSRMAREAGSVWCSGAMRYPPPTRGWQAANTRRRRQTSGPQTSSPNLTPETAPPGPTPGSPIASTSRGRRGNALLAQQEAASRRNVELEADMEKSKDLRSRRGRKEFYTSAKQNEEIEAGILTFKEPSPDRGPINQAPFGPGDETDAPYESDSSDYLDRDSFCTRRGSKVHPPRRKRKDRKDN